MNKSVVVFLGFLVFTGMVAGKFITVDPSRGSSKPANISDAKAVKDKTASGKFLSIEGGTLEGSIDMAGFRLKGLPVPENQGDAANKGYVDRKLGKGNASNSSTPNLQQVVDAGNLIDSSIAFLNGVELGTASSAGYGSVAIGRNARAEGKNSVAIGKESKVKANDTARIGSSSNRMDLNVSGDLEVGGEVRGDEDVWSYSFSVDRNGTEVMVPEPVLNSSYQVSVTPVESMARVGVFDKKGDSFKVKASEFTQVDVLIHQD